MVGNLFRLIKVKHPKIRILPSFCQFLKKVILCVWVSGGQNFEGLVQTESGGGQCLVCGKVFTFMHNAKVEKFKFRKLNNFKIIFYKVIRKQIF